MIDWRRIEQLKDEIGVDDVAEVVEMFIEEADECVAALSTGGREQNLAELFHALKGSALNLGFSDFASLCAAHEKSAAGTEAAEIDLPAAIACYEASKESFVGGLQERLSSA